jgi:drug/metabolite transporter superfamily protein YnfA
LLQLLDVAARMQSELVDRAGHGLASRVRMAPQHVDSDAVGRAYAAYGGVYIAAPLAWLWTIEGVRLDRWDVLNAGISLVGAAVIITGSPHRLGRRPMHQHHL